MVIYSCCLIASFFFFLFFLMIRRPPRSTRVRSSAASDVYKRQPWVSGPPTHAARWPSPREGLSLIHISEPTRLLSISYAVFCLKKKKNAQEQKKKKKKKNKTTKKKKKKT